MPRVLVVEDDAKLARMLDRGLGEEGFAVESVPDGEAGAARLLAQAHDVCVLDLLLPRQDGFAVLKRVRGAGVSTPILVLTARDAVADRVSGLNLGADDFLVKPFVFAELLARLYALLRRGGGRRVLRAGDLELDPVAHRVHRGGEAIELSIKQFALLDLLLRHSGQAISRAMILQRVWGYDFDPGTNIVDVHIGHLRQRIDRPGEPSLIQTVRGVGYRLAPPGEGPRG